MKVNDYVRTKDWGIQKIVWFDNEEPIMECGFTALQSSGYKSSPNIIDLIEVGDYVNGYYVEDVLNTFVNVATGSNYFQNPTIYEDDIKTVVTKEQFEREMYRVNENN